MGISLNGYKAKMYSAFDKFEMNCSILCLINGKSKFTIELKLL